MNSHFTKLKRPVFIFLVWGLFFPALSQGRKLKAPAAPAANEYLQIKDIEKFKKEKCTYFHVWATWCSVCMEEMPDLIKLIKSEKSVKAVIVDASPPRVQESFSKKWMQGLRPGFPTFLKPAGKEEIYLNAIEPGWSGALPFSALYQKGKLLKKWTGGTELKTLGTQFQSLCAGR